MDTVPKGLRKPTRRFLSRQTSTHSHVHSRSKRVEVQVQYYKGGRRYNGMIFAEGFNTLGFRFVGDSMALSLDSAPVPGLCTLRVSRTGECRSAGARVRGLDAVALEAVPWRLSGVTFTGR
jgi:hypothetical protein